MNGVIYMYYDFFVYQNVLVFMRFIYFYNIKLVKVYVYLEKKEKEKENFLFRNVINYLGNFILLGFFSLFMFII